MFWEDVRVRKRGERAPRQLAEIPTTNWKHPTEFPNLSAAPAISFDLETYDPELQDHGPGWGRGRGHIVGFSVAVEGGHRWYYPIRHTVRPEENHPNPEGCLLWLRDTLGRASQPKIGANLLYDVGWCRQEGIEVAGDLVDIQFGEALLDDRARVNLDAMAGKWLGESKQTDLLKKWIMDSYAPPKDEWRGCIHKSPPSLTGPYGEMDADLPLRIAPKLYDALWRHGLINLFRIECGLIRILVEMRFRGVSVDVNKAQELNDKLGIRILDETAQLREATGVDVNVNASASIAKVFDKLGLKYPRTASSKQHPKGQPSFRKEFLETVDHPSIALIRNIRRLHKLKDTFIEGYILNGHVNGKLYCSFHPLRGEGGGTIVGRFSSSDPNLQNIPIRDKELGKPIRSIFKPDEGHKQWRKYDYSQFQFRALVHYAQGPGAEEARMKYRNDPTTDYHNMVKATVDAMTGQTWDRRPIKNLNFGLAFGMGNEKAGRSTGLSGKKLVEFIAAYHKAVPFSKQTMRWVMELAETDGMVPTILGRQAKYDLWEKDVPWGQGEELNPKTGKPYPPLPYDLAIRSYGRVRRAYLHTALAKLLQGTEGDTIKSAMYKCWTEGVYAYTGVPRLIVHDEEDFSDPGDIPEDAWSHMRHIMETALPLKVPVMCGCDIGPNWGTTKETCHTCGHFLADGEEFFCVNCKPTKQ
jgi:DNA polymerase-1